MTISTTISRVAYVGNGASTVFMVPFPFFAASELEVLERSIAAGTETLRVLGMHYTVAGGDGEPGTVTAVSAPSSTTEWVIRRKTARTQSTDYTPNDPFPAETHEKALDRLTVIAQELGEESDRSLKFPKTDAAGLMATLPASPARAGRVLAFDGAGAPTISTKTLSALESEADNAAASAASAGAAATSASASAADAAASAGAANASALAAAAPIVAQGGTSGRTQAAHFGDVLSVKDFGCVGNGIADDTASFQGALNGAGASGRDLFVPPGTYMLAGVTITAPMGLRLDKGATLKLKNGANSDLIAISASDVAIYGGLLDGNKANQTSGGIGIKATSADRVLIEGVAIKNTRNYGIRLQDGDDLVVRNCRVTATQGNGIQFFCTAKSVNRALAEGNVIDRSDDATYSDGCVKMSNNSGGTIHKFVGCRIHNNRAKMSNAPSGANVVALEIWCASLLGAQSCAITDNVVYGSDIAISLNGSINGLIEGNAIHSARSIAAELADSAGSSIIGNTIDGAAFTIKGIAVSGASVRYNVTGNNVRNCATSPGTATGIYIGDTSIGGVIAGNVIYSAGYYGIEINGVDGHSIFGNAIDGNSATTDAICPINASDISICGNHIKNVGNGIEIVVNNATTKNNIVVSGNVLAVSLNPIVKTLSGGGVLGSQVQFGPNVGPNFGDDLGYITLDAKNDVHVSQGTTNNPSISARGLGSLFMTRQGIGLSLWIKEAPNGQTAAGYNPVQTIYASSTANRQSGLVAAHKGYMQFDTVLGKPVWWNGTGWRDATGAAV